MKSLESLSHLLDAGEFSPGLYLAATPIGNLGDITLRALNLLTSGNEIWAEDTRNTRKLLDLYGIRLGGRPLRACHDHNEEYMSQELVKAVESGRSVVYVSDAGMPLISDPGFRLVRSAIENDLDVTIAPGASSVSSALALSGLASDRFAFLGFVPNKQEKRISFLNTIKSLQMTVVVFESAHRVATSLEAAESVFDGYHQVVIAREITKKFEEVLRGSLRELRTRLTEGALRGELVLIFAAAEPKVESDDHLIDRIREGLETRRLKQVVQDIADEGNHPRKHVYDLALKVKDGHFN